MIHSTTTARRWRTVASVAPVVVVLLALEPATASATTTRCQDVTATGGTFVTRQIKVAGISCASARPKLRAWARRGASSLPRGKDGWRCNRLAGAGSRYACSRRRRWRARESVTFTLAHTHPTPDAAPVPAPAPAPRPHPSPVATPTPTPTATPTPTPTPEASITVTAPGTVDWGQSMSAAYSCTNAAKCTGTVAGKDVASGTALPTTGAPGPGQRTLKVEATDSAGRVLATKSVDYTVKEAGYYALTYDDGPHSAATDCATNDCTAKVLDELKAAGAHATFFLIGQNITADLALAKRIVAEGHWIGNHTMTHANVGPDDSEGTCSLPVNDPNWTPCHGYNSVNAQIGDTDAAINAAEVQGASTLITQQLGVTPQFFRPPYGSYNQAVMDYVRTDGMELANWTTDTNDWAATSATQVVDVAMTVPAGGILLMHDSIRYAIDATPMIVQRLRDERGLLPGKLAVSATQHFITGWEDAGGSLGFYVEAVAPTS